MYIYILVCIYTHICIVHTQVTECDFHDEGLFVPAPYEEFDKDQEAEDESGH